MRSKFIPILFALIFLVSCASPDRATPTPVPSETPSPTASPTPLAPLVILVLPADMPTEEYDRYQTLVYDLAQANGMRFQVRNTLTADDVALEGPSLKVVIALPPDPGLATLTAAAPAVQFLAVGIPDLAPAANLSVVGSNGVPIDQQAFLAGYIAGMVSQEWKVGVLYQKDTYDGEVARNAFINGFYFYCGYCRNPVFPQPSGIYPFPVGIPTDAPGNEYPAYADLLAREMVNVVYVYPEVATPELVTYITQSTNMRVIGETLPDEADRPGWIVSIQPDILASLKNIFPELIAGHGGQTIPTPLLLTDVNPDLLSEGKLRLAQEVLDGLQDGTIYTGIAP